MHVIPSPPHALSKLDRHWLAESIRLTEGHAGPLEDAAANRRARTAGGDLGCRILTRAEALAERDGLLSALAGWRRSAGVLLLALALAGLLIGAALAVTALERAQPVNVYWALGSLLGLHLATLLGWLVSAATGAGGGALGRCWLWLSDRLARDARAVQLGPALLSLLGRNGLARWGLGALVHTFWLLVLVAALATLLALLAAQRYGFGWETTLLSADTFVALTRGIGLLPSWLGFPVPDAATVRASDAAVATEAARRAWAGWLLGALVVYGVLPRLALAAFCAWRWRRGVRVLAIDPALPEYVALRERLLPGGQSLGVNDPAPPERPAASPRPAIGSGTGAVLVAVELDERHPWPPPVGDHVTDAGVVNSRAERSALLERLTRSPPARLAIACDPQRSVDRGTTRLIAELAQHAAATRVWLLAPPAGATIDHDRVREWHRAMRELGVEAVDDEPLHWLETGRD